MSEYPQKLADRYRRRAYAYLVLEYQRQMDDEALSDETERQISRLRPDVGRHAEEIYELFLAAPKSRATFFEESTEQQLAEIAQAIKFHYVSRHNMLIREQEAISLAHIVTMNFARLCHLNYTFRQHVTSSCDQGLFARLFR